VLAADIILSFAIVAAVLTIAVATHQLIEIPTGRLMRAGFSTLRMQQRPVATNP